MNLKIGFKLKRMIGVSAQLRGVFSGKSTGNKSRIKTKLMQANVENFFNGRAERRSYQGVRGRHTRHRQASSRVPAGAIKAARRSHLSRTPAPYKLLAESYKPESSMPLARIFCGVYLIESQLIQGQLGRDLAGVFFIVGFALG